MKKMDEMELSINQKGIKWSWFFMVLSLAGWGIYDLIKARSTPLPLMLFSLQFIVYFFVTSISKWKVGDETGKDLLVWYLGVMLFFLLAFGALLYFVQGKS